MSEIEIEHIHLDSKKPDFQYPSLSGTGQIGLPEGFRLAGQHLIVNVLLPEQTQSGLKRVMKDRDPRLWRIQPDAYSGTVEAVGPGCKIVRAGDCISIERWRWRQLDIDEARIIANEDEVLTGRHEDGVEYTMPGVVAMEIIPMKITRDILVPDGLWNAQKEPGCYHVRVVAINTSNLKAADWPEFPEVDSEYLIRKWEGQYRLGPNLLIAWLQPKWWLGKIDRLNKPSLDNAANMTDINKENQSL